MQVLDRLDEVRLPITTLKSSGLSTGTTSQESVVLVTRTCCHPHATATEKVHPALRRDLRRGARSRLWTSMGVHAAVDYSEKGTLSRRQVLAMLGACGGLLGLGYALASIIGEPRLNSIVNWVTHADGPAFGGATAWT